MHLKLKSITVARLLVFQVSRPIVASNFARKLSPKSTAGSVIPDSSAPGSFTSGLLDRDGTDEDEEDGDNGKEEE